MRKLYGDSLPTQKEIEANKLANAKRREEEATPPTPSGDCPPTNCSLRELIKDELRDLWQLGYDRETRDESVQHRLDAIMRIIEANGKDHTS